MSRALDTAKSQQSNSGPIPPFVAGKNKIINGDFGIWQRGTTFTNPLAGAYLADRFACGFDGSGATRIFSQQTFTPGTAPVAGYESQYYAQISVTTAGSTTAGYWYQRVEDVRTFAGQTITYSFWAKADSARTITIYPYQSFPATDWTGTGQNVTLTTSWARYSVTLAMPSVSGKTIGASSFMAALIYWPVASGASYQTWGHQMEAGSTATPFQTATGTIQGELAACQRYWTQTYPFGTAANSATNAEGSAQGVAATASSLFSWTTFPVTMRTSPTVSVYAGAGGSGAGSVRNNTAGPVITGVSANTINTNGFTNIFKSSAYTAASIYGFEYTASAEL
jgi:hypothetical protein